MNIAGAKNQRFGEVYIWLEYQGNIKEISRLLAKANNMQKSSVMAELFRG